MLMCGFRYFYIEALVTVTHVTLLTHLILFGDIDSHPSIWLVGANPVYLVVHLSLMSTW